MFTDKEISKHFLSAREFNLLPKEHYLIVGSDTQRSTWLLPYKDIQGNLVVPFLKQYADMFCDAGTVFCNDNILACKKLTDILSVNKVISKKKGVRKSNDIGNSELLYPIKLSSNGYITDYETFINLRFRIQLLLLSTELKKFKMHLVDNETNLTIKRGGALQAKFVYNNPHTFYIFGIQKVITGHGLTKRYFK